MGGGGQNGDQLLIKQCQPMQNKWSSLQLGQQTSVSINGSFLLEDCSPFTNEIKAMDFFPPKCTFLGLTSLMASVSFIDLMNISL